VDASEDDLSGCAGMLGTWNNVGARDVVARDGMTMIPGDPDAFAQELQFNPAVDGTMLFQDSRAPQLPGAQCFPPPLQRRLRHVSDAGAVCLWVSLETMTTTMMI
jgi:hypothetical protein